jgi:hypothetical protein
MNFESWSSFSGHSKKCQWFGIKQYAIIRIGRTVRASAVREMNVV